MQDSLRLDMGARWRRGESGVGCGRGGAKHLWTFLAWATVKKVLGPHHGVGAVSGAVTSWVKRSARG